MVEKLGTFGLKNIIVIAGNESSGNRFVADCVSKMTDYEKDDDKSRSWWNGRKIKPDKNRVTMSSLPHGALGNRIFYDVHEFINRLIAAGYRTRILLTTRDINVIEKSKTRIHTRNRDNSVQDIMTANEIILNVIKKYPEIAKICSYESLVLLGHGYLKFLLSTLNVRHKIVTTTNIVDGNRKYLK